MFYQCPEIVATVSFADVINDILGGLVLIMVAGCKNETTGWMEKFHSLNRRFETGE